MQQSSASIGTLAAALAKAQAQIANPEKSLTATIISPFPREESRTFRYAPLASGFDLVRKCPGQHEVATVQTTALDRETNQIRLTTTLMHSSGEWVSSDWPVCPISETAAPHRLGAALTYARRYALFTLVGIAGEDDLDAPDLPAVAGTPGLKNDPLSAGRDAERSRPLLPASTGSGSATKRAKTPIVPCDDPDKLRDKLLSELAGLNDPEALALWAQRALPLKNQLSSEDAQAVEGAFAARLTQLDESARELSSDQTNQLKAQPICLDPSKQAVTLIGKPVRERDCHHLKFVASHRQKTQRTALPSIWQHWPTAKLRNEANFRPRGRMTFSSNSRPIAAMPASARDPSPKRANESRGEMPSVTGSPPKP